MGEIHLYYSKMKINRVASFFIGLFLFSSYYSFAQTNADREAFAETFVKIFENRGNRFDSITKFNIIVGKPFEYDVAIKMPGADKCMIKDHKYLAEFGFVDRAGATSFFKTLQSWLSYTVSAYKSVARFIPQYENQEHLQFFMSDSSGFINAANYLRISESKNIKPFSVHLEIDSEPAMAYYTSYGSRINNPAISSIIKEVGFGSDPEMKNIKKNKKVSADEIVYQSSRAVPGYAVSIYENTDEYSIDNKLQLLKKWTGPVKTVNQKVDSLILMLKASLPASYCYSIDADRQSVFFYQHPFAKEKLDAEFVIQYGLNEGKKDSYYLVLIITRTKEIESIVEKQKELYSFIDVNGKYGFKDDQRKIIVPGKYDKTDYFLDGIARVKNNNKYGFVDITGKEIVPVKYDFLSHYYGTGLAEAAINWKFGMIDINGKEVIPFKYDAIDRGNLFYNDKGNLVKQNSFLCVKLLGKYGFIDSLGREIVPLKYDYAKIIAPGIARVSLNKKDGVINDKGREIVPLLYDAMNIDEYDKYKNIRVKLNERWGLVDNTGKVVIPVKYNYTSNSFSEDLAWVRLNDKYGFVDKAGKEIIPLKYSFADNFSSGLAVAKLNDKYGFIDKSGKEVIGYKYEIAKPFFQGLAPVKLNGKWGYINKSGVTVIPFTYDNAAEFEKTGEAKVYIGKKWGKINTKGVVVKPIVNEDEDDDGRQNENEKKTLSIHGRRCSSCFCFCSAVIRRHVEAHWLQLFKCIWG